MGCWIQVHIFNVKRSSHHTTAKKKKRDGELRVKKGGRHPWHQGELGGLGHGDRGTSKGKAGGVRSPDAWDQIPEAIMGGKALSVAKLEKVKVLGYPDTTTHKRGYPKGASATGAKSTSSVWYPDVSFWVLYQSFHHSVTNCGT